MAGVSTYLNFAGQTEAAFALYQRAFGAAPHGPVMRMGDAPSMPGAPPLSADERRLIMHMALPILGGHMLHGTDVVTSMGHQLTTGNNVHINLEPDTREETDRLFAVLSEGGVVEAAPTEMFWGAYSAAFTDRFGIHWMINCAAKR